MAKQLYEEALADIKKVKEVAEANAQRAIIEAVTPRIRELIETELFRESDEEESDDSDKLDVAKSATDKAGTSLMMDSTDSGEDEDLDKELSVGEPSVASAISLPDEEGKVTLDLDVLASSLPKDGLSNDESSGEDEFGLNVESIVALAPLLKKTALRENGKVELNVYKLCEECSTYLGTPRSVSSKNNRLQLSQLLSRVEDMYDCVQESISDEALKTKLSTKLEGYYGDLNNLQEKKMSRRDRRLNEEDVTLKLTGLPDDLDLDSVGVDLITGGDESAEEDDDLEVDVEESDEDESDVEESDEDESDDEDLELDLDSEEESDDEEEVKAESSKLDDDTVVEIDEGMLRREIRRMRSLREAREVAANKVGAGGHALTKAVTDDFGGGSVLEEPSEHEMELCEAEEEELDELGDARTRDELGGSATSVPSKDKSNPDHKAAAAKKTVQSERRLRARLRLEMKKLRQARLNESGDRLSTPRSRSLYSKLQKLFVESLKRSSAAHSTLERLSESRRLSAGVNTGASRPAEKKVDGSLRAKLAETNLINVKLMYTNKLLQNESMSKRQKARVIEQLDAARTAHEAKLVYESVVQTLSDSSSSLNEGSRQRVLGSSSQVTRSSAPSVLNESYETSRWERLAGISK